MKGRVLDDAPLSDADTAGTTTERGERTDTHNCESSRGRGDRAGAGGEAA